GWRAGFSILGCFGVGYAIVLIFCLRDAPRAEATANNSNSASANKVNIFSVLPVLFGVGGFWILLALNALVGVANWGINGWLPTYLREHFHLGLGAAGMSATAYIQIASFLGVLIGGAWADRWSRTNPRGRAFVPAIGYCIAGPCLFLSALSDTLPLAIAGLVVFGLGRGFFDANHMPILRQLVDERYSATGYGLLNFVSCAAGGVMIYIGGMLKDAHVDLSIVFQLCALGLLVAGVMLFVLRGQRKAA
ncbi:MAG: major facilitator superfamily 1, partial [Pedosphaera sp.]|nr:major facilitator superfamily 1 [Pedosphaera sp.]